MVKDSETNRSPIGDGVTGSTEDFDSSDSGSMPDPQTSRPPSNETQIRILREDNAEMKAFLRRIRDEVLSLDIDIDTEGYRWEINRLCGDGEAGNAT